MKISPKITLSALLTILDRICDPAGDVRPSLELSAFTAPHLPKLDVFWHELRAAKVAGSVIDEQIALAIQELGLLDSKGDRTSGGAWRVCEGAAMVAEDDDPALSDALYGVANLLSQGGLRSLTSARYDSIGGEAQRRATMLTPEQRTAMEQVVIGKKTLLDHFEGWVKLATELSAKEARRAELLEANKSAPRMTPSQLAQLKRDVIRRLERLADGIEDSELDEAEQRRILSPIESSSDDAARAQREA